MQPLRLMRMLALKQVAPFWMRIGGTTKWGQPPFGEAGEEEGRHAAAFPAALVVILQEAAVAVVAEASFVQLSASAVAAAVELLQSTLLACNCS
jgi:hypothetical protein